MPSVLSTKILTPAQKNLILHQGFSLVEYNAIQTSPLNKIDQLKNQRFENAIITSQKSVKIIKDLKLNFKQVFCVGKKTQQALESLDYKVVEVANYGADLAEIITANYADLNFDFFCGEQRRESIPMKLTEAKINFKEHHLYSTSANYKKFNRDFDAILFYSPSAVQSFFHLNPSSKAQLICIGKTTAREASLFSENLLTANTTSIESCIVQLRKM